MVIERLFPDDDYAPDDEDGSVSSSGEEGYGEGYGDNEDGENSDNDQITAKRKTHLRNHDDYKRVTRSNDHPY